MSGVEPARAADLALRARNYPGVIDAVAYTPADDGVVALFVAAERPVSPRALRDHLGDGPDEVHVLTEIPRRDGAPDRAALDDIRDDDALRRSEYVEPSTDTERYLAALWGDLLEIDRVGAQDDFFGLGGHSMLAVRVRRAVQRDRGVAVPAEQLFTHSVLADQAQIVDATAPDPT